MRGDRSCQKNPHELRAAPRARRRQLLCPAWDLPPWLHSALVPREGPGEPGVCPQQKEVRRRLGVPATAGCVRTGAEVGRGPEHRASTPSPEWGVASKEEKSQLQVGKDLRDRELARLGGSALPAPGRAHAGCLLRGIRWLIVREAPWELPELGCQLLPCPPPQIHHSGGGAGGRLCIPTGPPRPPGSSNALLAPRAQSNLSFPK